MSQKGNIHVDKIYNRGMISKFVMIMMKPLNNQCSDDYAT